VKIADFGHARANPAWLRSNADKSGSLVYSMAPEQWHQAPLPATDLYQCGVLWFLLLTGDFPFKGKTFIEIRRKHEEEDAPNPSSSATGALPAGADALARKLLRKNPQDRYASVAELASELERLKRGEPLAAEQKTKPRIRPRPKGWMRRPGS
jgi:eukaryotic-like serine/threonine-protein kinase